MTDPISTLRALRQQVPELPGEVRLEGDELVIDNPGARGAMTVHMMVQLAEIVGGLAERGPAVVRVRSEGDGVFCSGGHLRQVRAGLVSREAGATMCAAMTRVLDDMGRVGPVYIGVVDGPAYGGGAELVTAFDLVAAGPSARFAFVQGALGITTGWGGTRRLAQRVGRATALQILGGAAPFDVERAYQVGLVDVVGTDARTAARELAAQLSRCHPAALRSYKHVLGMPSRDGAEARAFTGLWGGAEHRRRLGLDETD